MGSRMNVLAPDLWTQKWRFVLKRRDMPLNNIRLNLHFPCPPNFIVFR